MELKSINYRGGLMQFSVPNVWIEEYDAKGPAMFYEDNDDSGTFRLNVLTFSAPNPDDLKTARELPRLRVPHLEETLKSAPHKAQPLAHGPV